MSPQGGLAWIQRDIGDPQGQVGSLQILDRMDLAERSAQHHRVDILLWPAPLVPGLRLPDALFHRFQAICACKGGPSSDPVTLQNDICVEQNRAVMFSHVVSQAKLLGGVMICEQALKFFHRHIKQFRHSSNRDQALVERPAHDTYEQVGK